jgi:hypothetical protein
MTVDAVVAVLASFPLRTWGRFNNPGHRSSLLGCELIFMRILTRRKKTLREIVLVAGERQASQSNEE